MKLTKQMRQEFVDAVLADLPPLPNFVQQVTDAAIEAILAQAPAPVRAAWADPDAKAYVGTAAFYVGLGGEHGGRQVCRVPSACQFQSHYPADIKDAAARRKVDGLVAEWTQAVTARNAMRAQLVAVADSCSTVEALAARLPEMADYIPKPAAAAMLPAVSNLVTDLMRAGWPDKKSKEGAA